MMARGKRRDVHKRAGHECAPFSLLLSITILLCAPKLLRCLCQSKRVLKRPLQSRHPKPNFCSILLSQWLFSAFCTLCILSITNLTPILLQNTCLNNRHFMSLGRPMQHFAQMPHSAHLAHTVPVTQGKY